MGEFAERAELFFAGGIVEPVPIVAAAEVAPEVAEAEEAEATATVALEAPEA